MKQDKPSAVVLVLGSVGAVLTMVLHPTQGGYGEGASSHAAWFAATVHGLAIASLVLQLVGGLAVFRGLGTDSLLSRLGLVALLFASFAATSAATTSGLTMPSIQQVFEHAAPEQRESLGATMGLFHALVAAFTYVFFVGTFVTAFAWSSLLVRLQGARAAGGLGLAVGVLGLIGFATGWLRPEVHPLGAYILLYAIWICSLAAWLWRE